MNYTLHSEPQGSDEWLAGRNTRLNASELVLAAGDSMNGRTRTDLIRKMATGIEPEVDPFTQKLYDEGHRFEALARPIAEQIIGRDLYPITISVRVDGLTKPLGASLDGATDDDDTNFEHKRMNAALRASLADGVIPAEYHWQMEQGQMINGATRTLFMASEWDDNDNLVEELHVWYESNPELRAKIIPTWKQAEADAANYQHVEAAPVAVAAPINELPALMVEITGSVTASNLEQWRDVVTARIAAINTDLQTDNDFADADAMVKFLDDGEKRIDLVKSQAQANAADIDRVFRALDEIKASMRAKRLELDKLVTRRKESIKIEIMQAGKDALSAHIAGLNKRLSKVQMPPVSADFAAAIKGKRNLESMRDAVSSLVAAKKIEANEIADRITINLQMLTDQARQPNADYSFLFADYAQLILKAPDDLALVIKSRIQDHQIAEERRQAAEREKIRAEEEAKATAKAKAEQEEIAAAELRAQREEIARQQKIIDDEAERQRKAAEEAAAKIERDRLTEANSTRYEEPAAQQPAVAMVMETPASPGAVAVVAVVPDNGRYIRLGEINALLGFTVTAEFLAGLGFVATQDKNARLYRECDVPAVCQAIIDHVAGVPERMQAGKLKAA